MKIFVQLNKFCVWTKSVNENKTHQEIVWNLPETCQESFKNSSVYTFQRLGEN